MLSPLSLPRPKGYIPSGHDDRDASFDLIRGSMNDLGAENATVDEHIIPRFVPVRNQTALGSCVAWTFTDTAEILLGIEMDKGEIPAEKDENGVIIVPKLSDLFLYWLCRLVMGTVDRDSGTQLRIAAKQLKNVGICPEATWPYDISKFKVDPGLEARTIASDNRLEGFYALNSYGKQRLDDIDAAINANHPVPFGTTVGTNFQNPERNTVLDVPQDSIGGHAMSIVGRRRRANGAREYLLLNHWSDQWADDGLVWVTENYILWEMTSDLWVGTRVKGLVL